MCLMIVTIIGCGQSPISEGTPSFTESRSGHRGTKDDHLRDIGEPDDFERDVGGVQIAGSALTDDHIAAIRALTDNTKPTNPNRYLIRRIEHTGPNTATNIWQTGHAQFYQKLQLVNGKWEMDEQGGGFGPW